MLDQTDNRYLNGIGSDLDRMRYLMDNAAAAQQSLGLQFGVSLTADQIAALDHSLLWWEKATVNGETVMVPKLYLSPKDVTVNNGSVIAGNNVTLKGGSITNSSSGGGIGVSIGADWTETTLDSGKNVTLKSGYDTGTLGFSDMHNEADFKTSHSGISLSGGGSFGDKFQGNLPGGMISAAGNKGHKEGTTQAAVADGTIIVHDRDNQKQDVANLSRDTEHANDSISPIFDKEKEQNRLSTVGMISDIGSQVADIAKTQGGLNALKAAQKVSGETLPANATEEQRQDYLAGLRNTQTYKEKMAEYGTGSDMQRGIQAATAALQGLAGGNRAGALAGASAPELANIIGHHAGINDDAAAKTIAHAILGGVTAALQGNSAAAGAVGAASGELIATAIARQLYPDTDPSTLTEEQKQTVSTLASVSAGIAGGVAGGKYGWCGGRGQCREE